jgi:hypothetical protein
MKGLDKLEKVWYNMVTINDTKLIERNKKIWQSSILLMKR